MTDAISEIDLASAWEMLKENPEAVLIDVRTAAEWQFVGLPTPPHGDTLLVEWNRWPDGVANDAFIEQVKTQVKIEQTVLLLCRSGARSRAAATALSAAGYGDCHNVTAGFEGGLDEEGHRGGGWKDSLPWRQQ